VRTTAPVLEIDRITNVGFQLPKQIAALQVRRLGMDWSEASIRDMLLSGGVTGFVGVFRRNGAPSRLDGYILFRAMADEGEILSLAVRPKVRKHGIASKILTRTLILMNREHVKRVFLEVSVTNRAAIAFYRTFGFQIIGVRKGYYTSIQGKKTNALALCLTLSSRRIRCLRQADSHSRSRQATFDATLSRRKTLIFPKR
jgi:[ribosomal protein S18]-alanine N-acetyltransferase